jgi:type IV fimbrial biogenesis protein FimT
MNKSRGFTLIELMVVVAIVAVLTTLAAPSFKAMLQSSNMRSAVNSFLADMRYARSESIRRGGGVVMCRSGNPDAAVPTCGTGSTVGWESGWIVFHNLNGGSTRTADEPLLRVQGPLTSINTIAETGAATVFKFTATGRLTTGALTHLTFGSPPDYATDAQRIVCVNVGGRARIAVDSEGQTTGNASCGTDQ